MYGKGILKGLSVTWKRFWDTYIDDIAWLLRGKKRYYSEEGIKHRSSKDTKGIFTIQYPEERLITPEEARYVPFLVYDEKPDGTKEQRCTSCGFCAEYCPFDAIIMDHDFELASYGRSVYNMEKLLKPASYYKSIRPQQYAHNEAERQAKEAAKAAKAAAAA